MEDFTWMTFLTGGVAGTVLTVLVGWRRTLNDRSMALLDQYLVRFKDIEEIFRLLGNRDAFDQDTPSGRANINYVRRTLDWMEVVAMLYIKGLVSRRIIREAGLPSFIRDFRAYLRDYGPPLDSMTEEWKFCSRLEKWPHGSLSNAKIDRIGG